MHKIRDITGLFLDVGLWMVVKNHAFLFAKNPYIIGYENVLNNFGC